jgi:hypothetical protein
MSMSGSLNKLRIDAYHRCPGLGILADLRLHTPDLGTYRRSFTWHGEQILRRQVLKPDICTVTTSFNGTVFQFSTRW